VEREGCDRRHRWDFSSRWCCRFELVSAQRDGSERHCDVSDACDSQIYSRRDGSHDHRARCHRTHANHLRS
jgi:hypothetical protein